MHANEYNTTGTERRNATPAHIAKAGEKMAQTVRQRTVVAAPLPGTRDRAGGLRRLLGQDWQIAIVFVAPMVLLMLVLIAYPFLDALRLSFTTRTLTKPENFVGLKNYGDLFQDRFFKDAVKNTFVFTIYSEVFKVAAGLIAALLLHNLKKGRTFLTGLVLLPWIVPTVVTALTWRSMLDPLKGGVNALISTLHLWPLLITLHVTDTINASWLGDQNLAMPSIILVNVWKGIPFFTLNFLAGLKAIDAGLYEAASVDGATVWEKFINVTLPGLRYVMIVTILLSTIWTFNSFDVIYLLTGGGPGGSTRTFIIFAYEKAIQGLQFGPGAAVALLMVPIFVVLIFFVARYMRRSDQQVEESGLDRFFASYGKLLLIVGLVLGAAALFLLDSSIFIHSAVILAVLLAIAFGFGRLAAALAERGEEQRRASGKARSTNARPNVLGRLPNWIAMAFLVLFVLAPFYWILITAFKSELQITTATNIGWPTPFTGEQFQKLLTTRPFGTWYRNTIEVALVTTVISVTFAAMAGYALARLRFRGATALTNIILLTYLLPTALLFIPLYQILNQLHLINSLGSLMVTYPTFGLPYASWLLMGYFRNIPEELEHAAMIDGANRWQAFTRITLPLAKPALLAVALFTFTNAWNEFLFAFVFISKEGLKTLPVGLQSMIVGDVYPYGQLMAASILLAVPVAVIYSYAQRFLVEGLTAGSVKG